MKLYKNSKIITMDSNMPIAEILVENEGKLLFVGLENDCPKQYFNEAQIIDLQGKFVVPGFWESHLHLIDGIRSLMELNLRNCHSFEQFKEKLIRYSKKDCEWVIGHGWDESKLFNKKFPNRQLIDNICNNKPVILVRMDGHSICVNSKAIEKLQLDKLSDLTMASYDNGKKLNGMFFENTANIIVSKVIKNLSDDYLEKLILKAQEMLLCSGITSINDICTNYSRYFDLFRKLQKEGKLRIRITSSPFGMCNESVEGFDLKVGDETDRLKIGPSKYFMDGSFGSRTGLLFEDYNDDKGNKGVQIISQQNLEKIIIDNEVLNKPINIHAIGDKAVHIVLDCIEASRVNNQRDIRSRIEHVQIVKNEDIERFKSLDVTASFQPVFLYEQELTVERLGKNRLNNVYRFRSFIDKGINVIFNSDWPYGGGDAPNKPNGIKYIGFEPLLGIHAACCLQFNEEEKVTQEQGLRCYTTNPAKANYREKELGKLAEGYFADFVVLSNDIIFCKAEDIINIEILMTVINGEIVYKKD